MRAEVWRFMPALVCVPLYLVSGCGAPADDRITVSEVSSPTPKLNRDDDNDNSSTFDGDCDDNNPSVYPGADEGPKVNGVTQPDGIDNDCDGFIDEGTDAFDNDGDGYVVSPGTGYPEDVDCDDTNASIYPNATDGCDQIDTDCDGTVDEDAADVYEPNETPSTAAFLGDISCGAVEVTFNFLPTDASAADDVDVYRINVNEVVGCDFGVNVELLSGLTANEVTLTLIKNVNGTPTPLSWNNQENEEVGANTRITRTYTGSGSANDSGEYFLKVESDLLLCNQDLTLKIRGEAP
ncbi:MAG: putative metal-binding motif-containing protein [Myxococcota bacterium]